MKNNSFISECVRKPVPWLADTGPDPVIVSSRIRLARNLRGVPFPDWAAEEELCRLWSGLSELLLGLPALKDAVALEMSALTKVEREILVERHLASRDLGAQGAGSGLVAGRDETVAVMVNEEDHLRIQGIRPALQLRELWRRIDELDSAIEERVAYAFSPKLGYLTACPTNVGTGLRASVMLHLPGLSLANQMSPVIKAVNKLGMAVRGLWGEGSEAAGNMFQISNQITLGEKEEALVERLERIALEIAEHERNARAMLMQKKSDFVLDFIGRARGILFHAHMLASGETLDMLSALRFGIELGIVGDWSVADINGLFLRIQPGHLQKIEGRTLSADKRDMARARIVREHLAAARHRAARPARQ